MSPPSPLLKATDSDPGDATLRNFRYQLSIGVIHWIGMRIGELPYESIYCEHLDDFLCARTDGTFDALQVKTKEPSDGLWYLKDKGLHNTFKRWTALERDHPNAFNAYVFYSNVGVLDSDARNLAAKSAQALKRAIDELDSDISDLAEPAAVAYSSLKRLCSTDDREIEDAILVAVIKKTRFVLGPSRSDFDDVLVAKHVVRLPGCANFPAERLRELRDELVSELWRASSLSIEAPNVHYAVLSAGVTAPHILAKRRDAEDITRVLADFSAFPFRFRSSSLLTLEEQRSDAHVLARKFVAAGLVNHIDSMKIRAVSAERTLLEQIAIDPVRAQERLDQLSALVKTTCDDVLLEYEDSECPYGRPMLRTVRSRLEALSTTENLNMLLGVAGLLTEECLLWWGPRFDLQADAAPCEED